MKFNQFFKTFILMLCLLVLAGPSQADTSPPLKFYIDKAHIKTEISSVYVDPKTYEETQLEPDETPKSLIEEFMDSLTDHLEDNSYEVVTDKNEATYFIEDVELTYWYCSICLRKEGYKMSFNLNSSLPDFKKDCSLTSVNWYQGVFNFWPSMSTSVDKAFDKFYSYDYPTTEGVFPKVIRSHCTSSTGIRQNTGAR